MKITVKHDSIVKQVVDAIVNPANSFGQMGGGVAGVIKEIGGEEIEEEAIENAPVEIGDAFTTTAGSLKCHAVIHAPTMRNPSEQTYATCVRDAAKAALDLADKKGYKKIAIPGMGTGVGTVSQKESAEAMVHTIKSHKAQSLEEVVLVDIDEEMVNEWHNCLGTKPTKKLLKKNTKKKVKKTKNKTKKKR